MTKEIPTAAARGITHVGLIFVGRLLASWMSCHDHLDKSGFNHELIFNYQ